MASRIVITCDRCGEVIKTRKPDESEGCISKVNVWVKETSLYDKYDNEWNGQSFQLCPKCASKLQQFLTVIDSEIIERKSVSTYDPNRFVKKAEHLPPPPKKENDISKRKYHHWTEEDDEFLRSHGCWSAKKLAAHFGVRYTAIDARRTRLGITNSERKGRPLSEGTRKDVLAYHDTFPEASQRELARIFNISQTSVQRILTEVVTE